MLFCGLLGDFICHAAFLIEQFMNYSILFCKKKEVILSIWIQLKEYVFFANDVLTLV